MRRRSLVPAAAPGADLELRSRPRPAHGYAHRVDLPATLDAPAAPGRWALVGRALVRGAQATGRAIVRGVAGAYAAVDADARRHVAELPLMGLTLLAPAQGQVVAAAEDGRRPVVFVHGLGGHRGNLLPLQGWLRLAGWRRLYGWTVPPGSFEERGRALSAYVAEVLRVNGLPDDAQVDLVAHSMGGLVARCALEAPETARRVATLVTLGTPHAGSHAARWLATPDHLALRPGSPLLARLAAQTPWRGPTRLVCLWSNADVLLLPATTAAVDGAENVELDGLTHYGFLLRPRCFRRVVDAISARQLAPAAFRTSAPS